MAFISRERFYKMKILQNRGIFITKEELLEEIPIASDGDYAVVLSTASFWIWEGCVWNNSSSGIQYKNIKNMLAAGGGINIAADDIEQLVTISASNNRKFMRDSYQMTLEDYEINFVLENLDEEYTVTFPPMIEDGQKIFIQNSIFSKDAITGQDILLDLVTNDGSLIQKPDLTSFSSLKPGLSSSFISYKTQNNVWLAE